MGADSEQGLKEILEENHYLPQHADYSCALRAVKQAFQAGVESLQQKLDAALGELRMIDEALARRPALDNCPDRYSKISLMCSENSKMLSLQGRKQEK